MFSMLFAKASDAAPTARPVRDRLPDQRRTPPGGQALVTLHRPMLRFAVAAVAYLAPIAWAQRVWINWLLIMPIGGLVVLGYSLKSFFLR